ncbi:MAG: efflux RND transporter periplasmic adaptor subunit [Candidatus Krumholzibacteria bacterium]|nr:efflux RND transporter periplasmic adaptor subunit [Candidatus Krumholzibacteria bacterium]
MARLPRKRILIFAAAAVVVIAFFVIMATRKKTDRIAVQIVTAEKQRIVETVTATGRIEPRTSVKISADVAAKITFLGVKEGDWVENGDLLVRLDQERYVAALEQAEANLRSVQANAELSRETVVKAEKELARIQALIDRKLESEATYDQAYSTVQIEKARHQSTLELVDQARASVKQARDNLSKTTIYAPMAGTISALNKEVGEIALGSQFQEDVIMIVSNLGEMEALVKVDENDIVNVSLGDSASIEIDALPDRVFEGAVREIASSASITGMGSTDQKTEFEVKLAILDPVEDLRPGMTASADIVIETRDSALCVPIQCVTVRTPEQLEPEDEKKRKGAAPGDARADSISEPEYVPDKDGFVTVLFVVRDGIARAVQVETGVQSDTHIEIVKGLAEGDEVVSGSYRAISQTLGNDTPVLAKKEEAKNGG